MKNFQTELLNEFEKIANKNNLEFVVQNRWSNCGAVYLMNNFKCIDKGWFSFQNQYASISFNYATKH